MRPIGTLISAATPWQRGRTILRAVAENFVGILRGEERATQRAVLRTMVLAVVVLALAALLGDLAKGARVPGPATGLALLGLLMGVAAGFMWGRLVVVKRYRTSLLASWNQWMRFSVACSRVDEVHRRVRGRPATRNIGLLVLFWAFILFLSFLVLLLTVLEGATALSAAPLFVFYTAILGWVAGRHVAMGIWVHAFVVSLDDLMRRGEVSLWGMV